MRKNSLMDQFKNLKHGQQLLAIVILFLVLTIGWIFLGIFAGQQESTISPALQRAAKPLTPQIDETTLEEIENKHYYSEDELGNFPIYKVISVNRGKERTVVPITYDETEQEDEKRSGSLQDIVDTPDDEDVEETNQPAAEPSPSPTPTPTVTQNPVASPEPTPDATAAPAF